MNRLAILGDFWTFMRARKKWWLLPLMIVFALLALVLVFAQSSVLAPFIYTIF